VAAQGVALGSWGYSVRPAPSRSSRSVGTVSGSPVSYFSLLCLCTQAIRGPAPSTGKCIKTVEPVNDVKCDKCGRKVDDRADEIEHLLDQHDDTLTSHRRDELKRELNQIDDGGGGSLPLRTIGIAVAALAVLVGGGYALTATGIVSFSAGGSPGPTGAAVGPPGSTHEHAQFSVFVNGDEIDFSQPRYQVGQTQNRRIHFEGGDGSRIHKHATAVTIGYAMDVHDLGINASCLTVHEDTYCEDGSGSVSVTVNGNEIEDPASHVIRDGEIIRISYSET